MQTTRIRGGGWPAFRQWLSLVVTLAMVLGLLPAPGFEEALAVDEPRPCETIETIGTGGADEVNFVGSRFEVLASKDADGDGIYISPSDSVTIGAKAGDVICDLELVVGSASGTSSTLTSTSGTVSGTVSVNSVVTVSDVYASSVTLSHGVGNVFQIRSVTVYYATEKVPTEVVTSPTAGEIVYGQTLAESTLTGGEAKAGDEVVEGTFAWKEAETEPSVSDSNATEYDVVFIPTHGDMFEASECRVTLPVEKAGADADAPKDAGRVYTGQPQALVEPGRGIGGTMQYALGEDADAAPADQGAWSDKLPTAGDAGVYHVWYRVAGDENHNDRAPAHVDAHIAKADPVGADFQFSAPSNLTYDGTSKHATVSTIRVGMGDITAVRYFKVGSESGASGQSGTEGHSDGSSEQSASGTLTPEIGAGDTTGNGGSEVASAIEAGTYVVKVNVAEGDNYKAATLVADDSWTFEILPKPVSITGASVKDRPYDGTTDAEIDKHGALEGIVAGDDVVLEDANAMATFDNKNVGEGKGVAFSGYALSGAKAANYALIQPNTAATITRRKIVVTGILAKDRNYDGTATAELSTDEAELTDYDPPHAPVTDAGVAVAAKDNEGTPGKGWFKDGNAGEDKLVRFVPYLVAGPSVDETGNYELVVESGQTTTAATITPLVVELAWANTALTYDGTEQVPTAEVTNKANDSDEVTVSVTGAEKDKGTYTATAAKLTGSSAGNYKLPAEAPTEEFAIAAKVLEVTGATAKNKVYDGTKSAAIDSYGTLSGLAEGDEVALDVSGASASFDTKDAATGKTVRFSGYGLSGADKGNYAVSQPDDTAADIAPLEAVLDWSPDPAVFTYDGEGQVPAATVGNRKGDDVVTVNVTGAQTNVGDYEAAASALDGADAANYRLPTDGTQTKAFAIAKAEVAVSPEPTAAQGLTYNGSDQALAVPGDSADGEVRYALGDAISGEAPADESEWSAEVPTARNAGTYRVWWRVDGDANHTDKPASFLEVAVAPLEAALTWSPDPAVFTYDGESHAPEATVSNAVEGDGVAVTVAGAKADANPVASPVYTATATALETGGLPTGNYRLPTDGTQTKAFVIARAEVSVSPEPTAMQGLAYNGSDQALAVPGATGDGALLYALGDLSSDEAPADGSEWSAEVPVARDAGTYRVWWRVDGDANHADKPASFLEVAVAPLEAALTWSPDPAVFTYDGESHAPEATVSNAVEGDEVAVTVAGAEADANAAASTNPAASPVYTATATALAGAAAGNYTLPATAPSKKFAVIQKSVDISGVVGKDKTYDGTVDAAADFTGYTLEGVVTDDEGEVALNHDSYKAAFSDKDAGEDKTVSVDPKSVSLTGGRALNYKVGTIGDAKAAIAPKDVSVAFMEGKSKVYDGTAAAELDDKNATITGIVAGDVGKVRVKASGDAISFPDANVGEHKEIEFTPVLEGDAAANYKVNLRKSQRLAYASIYARPVVVTAKDQSLNVGDELKSDDIELVVASARKDAQGSEEEDSGLVAGESLSSILLAYVPSSTESAIEGDPGTITPSSAAISDSKGTDVTTNYEISYETGKLKINADPKVTVEAEEGLVYSGSAQKLVKVTKPEDAGATYTVQFAVSETEPANDSDEWKTAVPQGADAGSYTIWWRVPASTGWNAVAPSKVETEIDKAAIAPTVTISGWTYLQRDPATSTPVLGEGSNPGGGSVTWEYKGKADPDSAYEQMTEGQVGELTDGDYTVRATVAETGNYRGSTACADFTVDKAFYTVSFETSPVDIQIDDQSVEHGKAPECPDLSGFDTNGYVLLGWFYKNAENKQVKFDFDTDAVTAPMELVARWTFGSTVTIDPANGDRVTRRAVTYGDKIEVPETPAWEGHVFVGWYEGDAEYDFSSPVYSDLDLVAKWLEASELATVAKTAELNDVVGVNVYVRNLFDAEHPERYVLSATFRGVTTVEGDLAGLRESGSASYSDDRGYKLRVAEAAADQYGDTVHVRLTYTNGEDVTMTVADFDYSVRTYCENMVAKDPGNERLVNVCTALLDFGAAAQVQFGYCVDELVNKRVTAGAETVARTIVPDTYAGATAGTCTGIKKAAKTLNLVGATDLRVYFYPEADAVVGDYVFLVDGTPVDATISKGRWMVSVDRIVAAMLGESHTFTVTNKNDGTSITSTCSAITYAYGKQGSDSGSLANVSRALYRYYIAAKEMFSNA